MNTKEIFDYTAQPLITRTSCPACGLPAKASSTVGDRYSFQLQVAGCSCGLTYLTKTMTRWGYDLLYRGTPSPYRRLVWRVTRSLPYHLTIDRVHLTYIQQRYGQDLSTWLATIDTMTMPRDVLDVGGSTGIVARVIAPDADVVVLDPSSELPTVTSRITPMRCYAEDLHSTVQFDLILLCQTIDHLVDPRKVLTTLRTLVRPGGHLYVDYAVSTRLKVDHTTYWDERSFLAVLERTGWTVVARRMGRNHSGALCQ